MCDDESCFDCTPTATVGAYPWRWKYVAVNGLRLVADIFGSVERFHRDIAQDLMASSNYAAIQGAFHEEAALEIESITATPED